MTKRQAASEIVPDERTPEPPRVLVVYGTTEGHTRTIATRAAAWLQEEGLQVSVVDSAALPDSLRVGDYDAYVLAGSLHETRHQASLVHFAKDHADDLARRPSLFLSASLTATSKDEKHQSDARRCMEHFYSETGWRPTMDAPVAGALLYTKYNFLKRMLLRMIVSKEGGDVDTSHDYEYTDWKALETLIKKFSAQVKPSAIRFAPLAQ